VLRQISLLVARQPWVRKLAVSTPGVRDLAWRFVAGGDLDTRTLLSPACIVAHMQATERR
jgi:hypothetical protein